MSFPGTPHLFPGFSTHTATKPVSICKDGISHIKPIYPQPNASSQRQMQRKQTQKKISAESGGDSVKGQPAAVSRQIYKYMVCIDLEILLSRLSERLVRKSFANTFCCLVNFSKYLPTKHIWKRNDIMQASNYRIWPSLRTSVLTQIRAQETNGMGQITGAHPVFPWFQTIPLWSTTTVSTLFLIFLPHTWPKRKRWMGRRQRE